MATRSAEEMVAYALEIEPALLPFANELFQDFEELGSDTDAIVSVVRDFDLAVPARLLDLGCGKGAAAIAIASALGHSVFGVDLYEPFIPHCRAAAVRASVSNLCRFEHADILGLANRFLDEIPVDVALFGALGDVLGPLDKTVGILRRFVRPGGYLVISDDYVKDGGSTDFKGYAGYGSREQTIARLESHGDRVIETVEQPNADTAALNARQMRMLKDRATALAERHPELADRLTAFALDQAAETAFLEKNMVATVWVVRVHRSDADST